MARAPLIVGHAYLLRGIVPSMWTSGHPVWGTPLHLAGRYLGALEGTRRWHGFEIRVDGADAGVIFMHDGDIEQLDINNLGDPAFDRRTSDR